MHLISFIIFRKWLDLGEVPLALLDTKITPVFKKKNQIDSVNYRAISITLNFSLIMEKTSQNVSNEKKLSYFQTY